MTSLRTPQNPVAHLTFPLFSEAPDSAESSSLAPVLFRLATLQREIGGISQKRLTQTLRSLQRDGLVLRRAYPVTPSKVEYSLTRLGRTLIDPLHPFDLRKGQELSYSTVEIAPHPLVHRSEQRIERRRHIWPALCHSIDMATRAAGRSVRLPTSAAVFRPDA